MMNAPSFDEVPIGNTDPTWSSTKPTSKSAAKDFSTAPYLPSANKPRRGSLKLSSFGDIDNYKNFVQSSRPTSNPTPTPNSPGAARSVFKDHSNSPLTPNTAKTARQSNLTPRSLQPRKMSSPKPAFCPSGSGVAAKNAHRARGMSGSIADSTMTPTKGNTVVRKPMSSTKKRTPKKLYRWELDPEQVRTHKRNRSWKRAAACWSNLRWNVLLKRPAQNALPKTRFSLVHTDAPFVDKYTWRPLLLTRVCVAR